MTGRLDREIDRLLCSFAVKHEEEVDILRRRVWWLWTWVVAEGLVILMIVGGALWAGR